MQTSVNSRFNLTPFAEKLPHTYPPPTLSQIFLCCLVHPPWKSQDGSWSCYILHRAPEVDAVAPKMRGPRGKTPHGHGKFNRLMPFRMIRNWVLTFFARSRIWMRESPTRPTSRSAAIQKYASGGWAKAKIRQNSQPRRHPVIRDGFHGSPTCKRRNKQRQKVSAYSDLLTPDSPLQGLLAGDIVSIKGHPRNHKSGVRCLLHPFRVSDKKFRCLEEDQENVGVSNWCICVTLKAPFLSVGFGSFRRSFPGKGEIGGCIFYGLFMCISFGVGRLSPSYKSNLFSSAFYLLYICW